MSSRVRIVLDGRLVTRAVANTARADVNRTFRVTGAHGLRVRAAATSGKHTVCAIALPTSTKSTQKPLG